MTRRLPQTTLAVVLATVLTLLVAWGARPADAAGPAPAAPRSAALVVIGIGPLTWDQVSPDGTPSLWGMTRDGSVAALTVKTPGARTCGLDAWATLSAGEGTALADAAEPCPALPDLTRVAGSENQAGSGTQTTSENRAGAGLADGPSAVEGWGTLAQQAATAAYSARLGLLGSALAGAGVCVRAAGPGAGLALADEQGRVAQYVERVPVSGGAGLAQLLTSCGVVVLDLTAPGTGDAAAGPAASDIDERIGQVLRAAPPTTDVLVASLVGQPAGTRQGLQVLVGTGPSFPPGTFRSPSTRIDGLAQLSDLTQTMLTLAGATATSTGGGVLEPVASGNNSEHTATAKQSALLDHGALTLAMTRVAGPFLAVWLAVMMLVLAGCRLAWRHPHRRGLAARVARRTGLVGACMPAATFLANLLPWWRVSGRTVWQVTLLLLTVLVIAAGLAWVCAKGPWQRWATGPLAAVSAVSVLVIGGDLVLGSRLQVASVFGLQPLVGGRFYGMGNVAFALYAGATVMLAAGLAAAARRRGSGLAAAMVVAVVATAALAVDVAPAWGADFGGPLALVPAMGYLAVRAGGWRMRPVTVLAVGVAGVAVVALVAWLDWRRAAASRTHLGRFVQSVLDGDAWPVVSRKLAQNLDTLVSQPALLALGVLVLVPMVAAILRPGLFGTGAWQALARDEPLVRDGLVAVLVLLLLAFVTNDTGAAIPPTAAMLLFPLVVATAMHHFLVTAGAGRGSGTRRGAAPSAGARAQEPPSARP